MYVLYVCVYAYANGIDVGRNSVDFVIGEESILRTRCAELINFQVRSHFKIKTKKCMYVCMLMSNMTVQSRIGRYGVVDLCLTAAGGFARLLTKRLVIHIHNIF